MSDEADIVERLLSDAAVHRRVADDCDCRPEHTANWQHMLNNQEAAAEITKLRAERDAAARNDMVLVPKIALLWLNGEAPDAAGKWFGEAEDEVIRTPRKRTPAYWWRSKFRSMVPNWPKAPALLATDETGGAT